MAQARSGNDAGARGKKTAAELVRALNQGLESIGSATNFNRDVDTTYIPIVLPLMAKSTRSRYKGVIDNYLRPAFGKLCLSDLTPLTIQRYFSGMASSPLTHESKDKIRDVLSGILGSAVEYQLLVRNPAEAIRLPAERVGRKRSKPYVPRVQFEQLIEHIPEPYGTIVDVAIYTGLRVSELAGLRWNDVSQMQSLLMSGFAAAIGDSRTGEMGR
jgi:integrase